MPLENLAATIAGHGFCCVQFAAPKSIPGFDTDVGRLSPGLAVHVRETFQRAGIQIAVLGCYINLADPDEAQRRFQLERFKAYLRFARDFGCSIVGTETGSVNSDFSFHPDNHGEAAFRTVVASVRELVAEAEKFGVCVGIEGVERYVISSPKRLRRLIDEVPSNNLQIIFDLVNLLSFENHRDQRAVVDEGFGLFGDRVSIIHAKDFVVADGKTKSLPAGQGVVDYGHLFRTIKERKPGISVLLEDTQPATVAESVKFVRDAYAKA